MVEDGYISVRQKEAALQAPLNLRSIKPKDKIAPYFVEHVRRYILEKYGSDVLYKEGLEIHTTLNINMQKAARQAMERGLSELEAREGYPQGQVQGALLTMEAATGAVKAMIGGRNFVKSEFNRATQSRRQPGSAFKPLIYTAAFDKGMTPSTVVVDAPSFFRIRPVMSGNRRISIRNFMPHDPEKCPSLLAQHRHHQTAPEHRHRLCHRLCRQYGITSPLSKNLSLALGTSGVTLQELVRAYGVLANQGKRVAPFFITKIVDRTGHVFEENQVVSEQCIDPRIAFMTAYIMQDVVESGTGRVVKSIGRPVAAKTGTTDDMRDAWFIGFTPSLVTGVWVGFDKKELSAVRKWAAGLQRRSGFITWKNL